MKVQEKVHKEVGFDLVIIVPIYGQNTERYQLSFIPVFQI